MANIDFVEKEYFEQLFGMRSGYVLDFSNRSFQEFVYSIMKIDIYAKYHGLSKAKILRNIIAEYDNVTVGKLLLELMRYMQAKNMIEDKDTEIFKKCAEIGNRLIGKNISELINSEELQPIIVILSKEVEVNTEQAKTIFRSLFLIAHGYASMFANNEMTYDEQTIISDLDLVFDGTVYSLKGGL